MSDFPTNGAEASVNQDVGPSQSNVNVPVDEEWCSATVNENELLNLTGSSDEEGDGYLEFSEIMMLDFKLVRMYWSLGAMKEGFVDGRWNGSVGRCSGNDVVDNFFPPTPPNSRTPAPESNKVQPCKENEKLKLLS
ncbi:unnamed protein product [Ilex paraguariensis]|uniref:Uncharacterized protein n=1 Tax=Ilex paraguariensis TaxID=185542 RepID=A0ABC8RAK6_9AQUA